MKLSQILQSLPNAKLIQGSADSEITRINHDSRTFQAGDAFVAIRGTRFDGHLFVQAACDGQASAIFVENERVVTIQYRGPVIKVPNTRQALNTLAHILNEKPTEKLIVVGVTGTNGKTTTTHLVEAILNQAKLDCGVLGTVDNHFHDQKWPSQNTTPEPTTLHAMLKDWAGRGAKACAMEVSSHALVMDRVESVQFDVGIFTNLTRDHLDFHGSMDNYIRAKARLFRELLKKSSKKNKRAILNMDDSHLNQMKPEGVPVWTYGLAQGDLKASKLELELSGTKGLIQTPKGNFDFTFPMIGAHNVSNLLGAVGAALHLNIPSEVIQSAIAAVKGVRGRMERVNHRQKMHVFVDYAHTDDGLRNVLKFLKDMRDKTSPEARIITVFGCGGDRDKGKRPLMMKTALSYSELVVATSDNPRTEDPIKIIEDMMAGCSEEFKSKVTVEVDRRRAIEIALKRAKAGDIVLIAGKGHEDYQIVGTKKLNFDDLKVAEEILR